MLLRLGDKDLYKSIVMHRQAFFHMGGVDYNLHQPQTINPIPIPEFIDAWLADYNTMQEQMIYGDSPTFGKMIEAITNFTENKINPLEWKMDVVFP